MHLFLISCHRTTMFVVNLKLSFWNFKKIRMPTLQRSLNCLIHPPMSRFVAAFKPSFWSLIHAFQIRVLGAVLLRRFLYENFGNLSPGAVEATKQTLLSLLASEASSVVRRRISDAIAFGSSKIVVAGFPFLSSCCAKTLLFLFFQENGRSWYRSCSKPVVETTVV